MFDEHVTRFVYDACEYVGRAWWNNGVGHAVDFHADNNAIAGAAADSGERGAGVRRRNFSRGGAEGFVTSAEF